MKTAKPVLMALGGVFAFCVQAALKTTFDVGDYVQDGLLVNFDAIRNCGPTADHDSSATTWTDVSGNGYTATRSTMHRVDGSSGADAGQWLDDAYEFKGYSYWGMTSGVELGSDFCVQLVTDIEASDFADGVHTYHNVWASGEFSMFLDRSYASVIAATSLVWKTDSYKGDTSRPTCSGWGGQYITATLDAKRAFFFPGTDWSSVSNKWGMDRTVTTLKPVPSLKYTWGGRSATGSSCKYCSKGKFYAWRAYSRKLGNAELRWNRGIDEIRFHGATALPATNVVVWAYDGEPPAAEAPGAYLVDGQHQFTAADATVGKCAYQVAGYELEAWDEASGTWGEPVFHAGKSYTYVSTGLESPMVRLHWKWTLVNGMRRFGVGDYVSDGLLVQYDGICNVGEHAAHDDSTTVWKDLSGAGNDASRKTYSGGSAGAWTADGYRFEGYSYFKMSEELGPFRTFTFQVSGDFDMRDFDESLHHEYPTYLYRNGGGIEVFMDRSYAGAIAGNTIYFKGDSYTGTNCRPQFTWKGKCFSGAFDAEAKTTAMTQTNRWIGISESWGYTRAFTAEQVETPAAVYMFGGYAANSAKYCCRGKLSALRFYSRKLTDAELAVNYDLDGIRFYDRAPTHLADAVTVRATEFAADEDGLYKLVGTCTFTAGVKKIGDDTYSPRWTLETYDAATSQWRTTDSGKTGECALTATGAAPRRLTWTWKKDRGLIMIVR